MWRFFFLLVVLGLVSAPLPANADGPVGSITEVKGAEGPKESLTAREDLISGFFFANGTPELTFRAATEVPTCTVWLLFQRL